MTLLTAGALLVTLGKATGAFDAISRGAMRLGDIFNESFAGIKDAIMGGDLQLAWEIVLAGFKTAWLDFKKWLSDNGALRFIEMGTPGSPNEYSGPFLPGGPGGRSRPGQTAAGTPNQELIDSIELQRIELNNLREAASIAAGQAEARRVAGLSGAGDFRAITTGGAAGTFNASALFGFGSQSPTARLEEIGRENNGILREVVAAIRNIQEPTVA